MYCTFCYIVKERIITENEAASLYMTAFPVSQGHILVILKKHIDNYFEADAQIKE